MTPFCLRTYPFLSIGIAKVGIFSFPANFSCIFLKKESFSSGFYEYLRSLMDRKRFISVILPLKLEWEPCYWVKDGLEVRVGDRVRVEFARKRYIGVVDGVDIEPEIAHDRIMEAGEVIEGMDRISPQEIELWKQVAQYYMCSVGEVYKAAYPVGKSSLEEARAAASLRNQERIRREIRILEEKIDKRKESIRLKEEKLLTTGGEKAREKLMEAIARNREQVEALSNRINSIGTGNRGLTENIEDKDNRALTENIEDKDNRADKIILTEAQEKARDEISTAFSQGKPAMLHGVTGSGKTEIYISLALDVLSKGQNVLYLVPEIALSRQLENRLAMHFGRQLLVFHSAQSAAQKRDIAAAIRHGEGPYIVLGTRSSLFLPHRNLGLIIVDEEHDSSYKQDSPAPRYNGRDTALMLSLIQSGPDKPCNIVLGSATPSLEELYNCMAGRHVLVRLNERYHGAQNADIEIIDTRLEMRRKGMRGNFSLKLIGYIRQALEQGGQVIILRARRAWASSVQCSSCGTIMKCPHCNVSLSLHKGPERLVCHYCGWTAPFEGRCSKCGGELHSLGAGTQKIEEEAAALFPEASIARLDSDITQNKALEIKTIQDFSKGYTDILIGTQIITKGFDFSRLRLVAVIGADSMLSLQDFRADEKTMQTLMQLRGRCGRRQDSGLFVIQTAQPEHPVYQQIKHNQPEDFNLQLLSERKEFAFPPYSRIIEIQTKDSSEDRAAKMSDALASRIISSLSSIYPDINTLITGPYTPMPDKINDNYIRMIRLCLKKDKRLKDGKAAIGKAVESFERSERYTGHFTINVDPA